MGTTDNACLRDELVERDYFVRMTPLPHPFLLQFQSVNSPLDQESPSQDDSFMLLLFMLTIAMSAIGFAVIVGFLILVFLNVPVAVALFIPSILYVATSGDVILIAIRSARTLNSFTLLAVPLFIFVGTLIDESGLGDRIFDFASDIVGHFTGGLAQVNILASLIFSGMSGSALADVGGIGKVLINTMIEGGYTKEQSAAVTVASATIGPIFPPSIPLILYGILSETSVISLLLAGIVPAFVATFLLIFTTILLAYKGEFPSSNERKSVSKVRKSFISALPALLAPVLLVGGMLGGFFSPTEVSAVTLAYIFVINTVIYRKNDLSYILEAGKTAARTTGVVFFILAGAAVFSYVLTVENIPETIGTFLFSISTNTIILLLFMNLALLIIGMVLEPITALVMTIPIFVPPLTQIGVNPIHIGVIMVFNLMIGLLTPPFGITLLVSSDLSGAKVDNIVDELRPYYVALLLTLLLITVFPAISLWILNFI